MMFMAKTTPTIHAAEALRAALRLCCAALAAGFVASVAACAGRPGGAAHIPDAPVLLLGEVHDNPDGHARRTALLAQRIERGWRPAIAMEQFDRERQEDLDRALSVCGDAD